MTINAVVAEANMGKGSFYTHFATRTAFISELLTSFHQSQVGIFLAASAGMVPGAERTYAGFCAYLDACVNQRDAIALAAEARWVEGVEANVRAGFTDIGRQVVEDLEAEGWPDPLSINLFLVAVSVEIALAEAKAGGPREDLRDALLQMIKGPPRPATDH